MPIALPRVPNVFYGGGLLLYFSARRSPRLTGQLANDPRVLAYVSAAVTTLQAMSALPSYWFRYEAMAAWALAADKSLRVSPPRRKEGGISICVRP